MQLQHLSILGLAVVLAAVTSALPALSGEKEVVRFARFQIGGVASYGVVDGDNVTVIEGDIFGTWKKTARSHRLADVTLLPPTQPTQILAMAGNYRSHLAGEQIPPKFQIPQAFFKSPSCLVPHGGDIVIPEGTNDVHYEAELVIVIGKKARNVPVEKALDYVLGVTCGNDVSARDWQKNDVQWWRAKGSDTFGPCGPCIVTGLNYDDLRLQLRHNGKVVQDQRTSGLIHNVPTLVSYLSKHITLVPGDLIYTGTPGTTKAMKPGDTVEVELEGVGTLKNRVISFREAADKAATR